MNHAHDAEEWTGAMDSGRPDDFPATGRGRGCNQCVRYEAELTDLRAQLEANAAMLAKQCDLARQAELDAAELRAQIAALHEERKEQEAARVDGSQPQAQANGRATAAAD